MQSQLNFEFTKAHAPAFQGIMGDTCDERAATAIRSEMTFDEMRAERQLITDTGMRRYQDGDRTGLGGARGHQMCGTPFSVMDWLSDAECARFHHLGLALPTSGEEQEAARQRIQERLKARRALRQLQSS
jgi:alkanesulfonate monooxygenase SsuD/methylene tetrahydromethanopterin reductase-like flavin-dependent oxidoreductase (luciferase family)